MKRRVLVTGSAGYIGRHLVQRLLTEPDTEIFGLNRKSDEALPDDHCLAADLLEADLTKWLIRMKPEVVFHAAGTTPQAPFSEQLLLNAEGTRRLLQGLADAGLNPRVVIIGSAAEYGLRDDAVDETADCRPEGEYGISKLAQTRIAQVLARRYDLSVCIGRVFNVYGQTEQRLAIASLASQVAQAVARLPEPSTIQVQNLKSWRDFVHVDDAVEALLQLSRLNPGSEGVIYNIASGHSAALGTVLDKLLDLTGLDADTLKKITILPQGIQQEDVSWADISRLRQATGWEPQVSLEEGLRRELAFWRNQLNVSVALP